MAALDPTAAWDFMSAIVPTEAWDCMDDLDDCE
jgi:hypothetical protein